MDELLEIYDEEMKPFWLYIKDDSCSFSREECLILYDACYSFFLGRVNLSKNVWEDMLKEETQKFIYNYESQMLANEKE